MRIQNLRLREKDQIVASRPCPGKPTLARIFHRGRGSCADACASQVARDGRSRVPRGTHEGEARGCAKPCGLADGSDGAACKPRRGQERKMAAQAPRKPA
ncbi:MAG: hypothetical protein OHK0044_28220 [Burkholderiaceae bacterium]